MRSRPMRVLSHEHMPPKISIHFKSLLKISGGDLAGWVAGFQSEQIACGPETDLHILLWFLREPSLALLTPTVISEFSS